MKPKSLAHLTGIVHYFNLGFICIEKRRVGGIAIGLRANLKHGHCIGLPSPNPFKALSNCLSFWKDIHHAPFPFRENPLRPKHP